MAAKRLLFGRRLRTTMLAAALVFAVGVVFLYGFYRSLTSRIKHDDGYFYPAQAAAQEEIEGLAADIEKANARELNTVLRRWAQNEIKPQRDRAVLNILLCGVDSESGQALGGRSDAIILATVSRRDKTVTLTSIYRDSYTYIDLGGDPANPRALMDRVNAAYSLGGPATLMDTLEANYKIVIDNYISVDFQSFPRLIDALDGVRVDVTREEADYINRTAHGMRAGFPAGKGVRLSGEQALVYTRVYAGDAHGYDADAARAARQRQVLSAILESARDAAPAQLLDAMRQALQYVATDLSEDEIDRLSKDAILQGWLKYSLRELQAPLVHSAKATGASATIGGKWLWLVDYPRDARRLQLALYGAATVSEEEAAREDYLTGLLREGA